MASALMAGSGDRALGGGIHPGPTMEEPPTLYLIGGAPVPSLRSAEPWGGAKVNRDEGVSYWRLEGAR